MLWISPWIGNLTIMNSMKLILPHCTWHVFGFPGIPSEKTEPKRFTINFFLMSSHAWFLEIPLRCRQHKSCKCCYVLMICFENMPVIKYLIKICGNSFSWKKKLDSVYVIYKLKLLLSSFCKCYCSVMPLEGFTSKFNVDRPKECNKSLINITDIELTWLKRTESVYRKE